MMKQGSNVFDGSSKVLMIDYLVLSYSLELKHSVLQNKTF